MNDAPSITAPESKSQLVPLVLTREQTAELLAVRPDTVENLHRVGQLPGVLIGKHLRWRPADVERFVATLKAGGVR